MSRQTIGDRLTVKQRLLSHWDSLDQEYVSVFRPSSESIAMYMFPEYRNFHLDSKPTDRNPFNFDAILNPEAVRSAQVLAATMQGGLFSQSKPWFNLSLADKDLASWGPVKSWLATAQDIMYRIYAGSNFYTEGQACLLEEAAFGTGCMAQVKHPSKIVQFMRVPPGSYRVALGVDGKIDTMFRTLWYTARQIVMMFGRDKVSDSISQSYDTNPYELYQIIHAIYPNDETNMARLDYSGKLYMSCWLEKDGGDSDQLLRKSGFEENPLATPRWYSVGNIPMGIGPGHRALGRIMLLQEIEKTTMVALHREVDPPLEGPAHLEDVVSLLPGAYNPLSKDDLKARAQIKPILDVKLDLNKVMTYKQDYENTIKKTFMVDLLQMIASMDARRDVSATEILERKAEKNLVLGPSVDAQIIDLLDVTIDRTFNICLRGGYFPVPPPELGGAKIDVEYVSILAREQKLVDAQAMRAWASEIASLMQLDERIAVEAALSMDTTEYLSQYATIVGVPDKVMRPEEEIRKDVAAVQAAQAQAQRDQQLMMAAQTLKEAGQTKTEEGTLLGDMVQGAAQ